MSSSFHDPEFGEITVNRRISTRYIRIRASASGQLVVSAPRLTTIGYIRSVIDSSRQRLRQIIEHSRPSSKYIDGQNIGKFHNLRVIRTSLVSVPRIRTVRQTLIVDLPPSAKLSAKSTQDQIRQEATKILRGEAKQYLPKRLKNLAQNGDFNYERLRFSHSRGRWGSCSTTGTISLNIALMKLPNTLIDYVLIHELCHTHEMNHSKKFWKLVEQFDPLYISHRRELKSHTPAI